ncbi:MAG TPA: RuvX/YqgF family protein [Candidatus Paceibacterota bacterium]|nr:RuvX/YqgF family protein [Candidatus Paceibacterota bacterium]
MRYVGIDYGEKRIGIALSDAEGRFAFSKEVIQNVSNPTDAIVALCIKEGVDTVVIGESKNYKGEHNSIMKRIIPLVEFLKKAGLSVVWEPEFMSSQQAEYHQGAIKKLDASAAAIILQSYLDKKNSH